MLADHRARHGGLLLPHHDVLLPDQVGAEDRRRHGLRPVVGGRVLVWVNVGGATGGAIFGLLTLRFNLKTLTMAVLLLSTVMITSSDTRQPTCSACRSSAPSPASASTPASSASTRSSRRRSRRTSARPAPASRSASAAAARCWRRSSPGSSSPPGSRSRRSRSRWPPVPPWRRHAADAEARIRQARGRARETAGGPLIATVVI